jgi:hypothetical protein
VRRSATSCPAPGRALRARLSKSLHSRRGNDRLRLRWHTPT